DIRTCDRRRPLRPQRQRAVGTVVEGVHLLVHHVGRSTRRACEERRVLEAGCLDPAAAVEERLLLHRPDDVPPQVLARQDVVRSARSLELAGAHDAFARRSPRNGFDRSSRPSVVGSPWPGYTAVSGPNRSSRARTDASSACQSPPGKSTRPTEPAKRRSPEKSSPSAW